VSLTAATKELITARKRAKNEREHRQGKLIENREVHKATMEAKLSGLAHGNQFHNFVKCGREEIYRTCASCSQHDVFYFSCNRKWCPLCNYKIGARRGEQIRTWATHITQPKHLVLTMRNFPVLTGKKIRAFQQALLKLRRRDCMSTVLGGCMSLEITNEGSGWHLHAHCLLDVRWLDMARISIEWGKLIGQEFGIVKVKDVRGTEFVQEVAKYVAKGSELASWPAEQLWEFICAIKSRRFFFAFGSLRKAMPDVRRQLALKKPPSPVCACGCGDFIFETDRSSVLRDIRRERRKR
jgi:Replication protein/Transposase zinc-binding domain